MVAGLVLVTGATVALVLLRTPSAPAGPAPAAAPVVVPAAVPAAPAAAVPTELVLPDGTTSAVVPVGVAPDGQMEVPERVAEVGWYRYGPTPGVAGSSVLAGHVDDREQGPGAFARLDELAVEQTVVVRRAGAPEQAWRVADVRTVDKDDLDLPALFGRDGPARLTLVTCGGAFDRGSRRYEDNVVVTAMPR